MGAFFFAVLRFRGMFVPLTSGRGVTLFSQNVVFYCASQQVVNLSKGGDNMHHTKSQLLCSFAHLMKTDNKHCIIPSPGSMVDILAVVYQNQIGLGAYYKATHDLIREGYIVRQFRYDKKVQPEIRQLSSMISFTLKGVRYLIKMGVMYAFKLYKAIRDWMNKGDARFPRASDEYNKQTVEAVDHEYNLSKVRELLLMLEATADKKGRLK